MQGQPFACRDRDQEQCRSSAQWSCCCQVVCLRDCAQLYIVQEGGTAQWQVARLDSGQIHQHTRLLNPCCQSSLQFLWWRTAVQRHIDTTQSQPVGCRRRQQGTAFQNRHCRAAAQCPVLAARDAGSLSIGAGGASSRAGSPPATAGGYLLQEQHGSMRSQLLLHLWRCSHGHAPVPAGSG